MKLNLIDKFIINNIANLVNINLVFYNNDNLYNDMKKIIIDENNYENSKFRINYLGNYKYIYNNEDINYKDFLINIEDNKDDKEIINILLNKLNSNNKSIIFSTQKSKGLNIIFNHAFWDGLSVCEFIYKMWNEKIYIKKIENNNIPLIRELIDVYQYLKNFTNYNKLLFSNKNLDNDNENELFYLKISLKK